MSLATGTPLWVDLATKDIEGAKKFYESLFGWETEEVPGPDGKPMYYMFKKDGKYSCGMAELPAERQEMPASWSTYIKSDDVAADLEKVKSAGGRVMDGPTEVPEMGTMGLASDDQGAVFLLWKDATNDDSAGAYNQPGFLSWNELATKDMDAAQKFYQAVFGWEAKTEKLPHMDYTTFNLNGSPIGGGYEITAEMGDTPPHWAVYFEVADIEETKAAVTKIGGKIVMEPMTIDPGTFMMLQDPQGAYFVVIEASS